MAQWVTVPITSLRTTVLGLTQHKARTTPTVILNPTGVLWHGSFLPQINTLKKKTKNKTTLKFDETIAGRFVYLGKFSEFFPFNIFLSFLLSSFLSFFFEGWVSCRKGC